MNPLLFLWLQMGFWRAWKVGPPSCFCHAGNSAIWQHGNMAVWRYGNNGNLAIMAQWQAGPQGAEGRVPAAQSGDLHAPQHAATRRDCGGGGGLLCSNSWSVPLSLVGTWTHLKSGCWFHLPHCLFYSPGAAGGGQLYMWGKVKSTGDSWMYPKVRPLAISTLSPKQGQKNGVNE